MEQLVDLRTGIKTGNGNVYAISRDTNISLAKQSILQNKRYKDIVHSKNKNYEEKAKK